MTSRLRASLQSLVESGSDFIVGGDIAAALQGAPLGGFDFSVIVPSTPTNERAGIIRMITSAIDGRGYFELLPHATVLEIAPGLRVRVLTLEALVGMREARATQGDIAALPTLRATLAETRRLKSQPSTTSE